MNAETFGAAESPPGDGLPVPPPDAAARPWVAAYPPGVPATYAYPDVPFPRLLDDAAKDFPHTVALDFLGHTLTYRELLDHVDRLATGLAELGVGRGDRVGVVLPNCPQFVISLFATLRLGAVAAVLHPDSDTAQVTYRLTEVGCRVAVCPEPVRRRFDSSPPPALEHVVVTSIRDYLPLRAALGFGVWGRRVGWHDTGRRRLRRRHAEMHFPALVARSAPAAPQEPVDPSRHPAVLCWSRRAGPRGPAVVLTHRNLVANAFQGRLWLPDVKAGGENVLAVTPASHPYGLTLCLGLGTLSAATLTLLPGFDRDRVLDTIERRRPTIFPGLPGHFAALVDASDAVRRDLSSLRVALCGGGPLAGEVADRFEELTAGKLREGYGLTETAPITHANPVYGKAKRGRVGLPVPDTAAVLASLDDPGRLAAPGRPGQLLVAGPQVTPGYWGRPAESAAVLVDGWLRTGDVAEIDEDGYLRILGRVDSGSSAVRG